MSDLVSKYKTFFEKSYTLNWIEVFTIVKVQNTNSVTYLLKDYSGKFITGAFYEHELHRGHVSRGESTERQDSRQMVGIR